jgi:hypothetical protein
MLELSTAFLFREEFKNSTKREFMSSLITWKDYTKGKQNYTEKKNFVLRNLFNAKKVSRFVTNSKPFFSFV